MPRPRGSPPRTSGEMPGLEGENQPGWAGEPTVIIQEKTLTADLVVVGSGLFGLTIAEQAATELGLKVALLDRRSTSVVTHTAEGEADRY